MTDALENMRLTPDEYAVVILAERETPEELWDEQKRGLARAARLYASNVSLETLNQAITDGLTRDEWRDALEFFLSDPTLVTIEQIAKNARRNAFGTEQDPEGARANSIQMWTNLAEEFDVLEEAQSVGLTASHWSHLFSTRSRRRRGIDG